MDRVIFNKRKPQVEKWQPDNLRKLRMFKAVAEVQNKEIAKMNSLYNKIYNNLFLETADMETVKKLEEQYGIVTDPTVVLEDRIYAIKAKMLSRNRFTEEHLIKLLLSLTSSKIIEIKKDEKTVTRKQYRELEKNGQLEEGAIYKQVDNLTSRPLTLDMYIDIEKDPNLIYQITGSKTPPIIAEDYTEGEILYTFVNATNFVLCILPRLFKVKIRMHVGSKHRMEAVQNALENIVPCNMELDLEIKYSTHKDLTHKTHADLGLHTHKDIREGGI